MLSLIHIYLDVIESMLLTNDSGLLCTVLQATKVSDRDCTEFYLSLIHIFAIKSILFIFLALFADQIMGLILGIAGTPYCWVVDTALPPIEFSNFGSVLTVIVVCLASGSVSLIVLILVIIIAWNYRCV